MDDAIYANDDVIFSDSVRKSGNRNSYGRGHPGFPPGAAPSVSRRFQVLLAVLCVTLICVLGTIGVLYSSKSNQFESLKAQHSNLSERLTDVINKFDSLKIQHRNLSTRPTVNLAFNGVAAQSSLYNYSRASIAIDGDKDSGSCTHTQREINPWWRVDLRDFYKVRSVSITNRGDCCAERLDGAEIRIGNSLENNGVMNPRCAVISHIPAGETHYFQCNEMEGRYVVVVIPGRAKWLTLCEVDVYGSRPVNLALNGEAVQSSLLDNYIASRAIDGDRQTSQPYFSHTQRETNPWWRVDLRDVYRVRSVSITNRGDCCSERLDGAEIRIGNSLENNGVMNPRCAVIHIPAGETQNFQCNEMEGRYVVVVIPGSEKILTLCEVDVYGSRPGGA